MTNKISFDVLMYLMQFEGFRENWYRDPAGVDTIGYGFTRSVYDGPSPISKETAKEILIQVAEDVRSQILAVVDVSLSSNQLDALILFVYNLGIGRLETSTLLRKLNLGDYDGAAKEFTRWVYGGGKILPGLVDRRKIEQDIFLGKRTRYEEDSPEGTDGTPDVSGDDGATDINLRRINGFDTSVAPDKQQKITLITPTIGSECLRSCLESVEGQSANGNFVHYVVVDGREYDEKVRRICDEVPAKRVQRVIYTLEQNTGHSQYNGHRIYGAFSFLIETPYVMWLDEDNMIRPDHIESVVENICKKGSPWGWAYRSIIDQDGQFVCDDHCESLGTEKNVLGDFLVDVNCFCLKRSLAAKYSWIWMRKARDPILREEVDRLLTRMLINHESSIAPPSHTDPDNPTVLYRVGSRPDSVTSQFFILGNTKFKKRQT